MRLGAALRAQHAAEVTWLEAEPTQPACFASASEDGSVRLWDARAGTSVRRVGALPATATRVRDPTAWRFKECACVKFLPSDTQQLLVAADQSVAWVDLRGKGVMVDQYAMNLSLAEDVNEIAVSPDGATAIACLDSGNAVVVDIESKQPKRVIRAHAQICTSAVFAPGQPTDVFTGGLDSRVVRTTHARLKRVAQWDMRAGSEQSAAINPPYVQNMAASSVNKAVHPNALLAIARGDGYIQLNDVRLGRMAALVLAHSYAITRVLFPLANSDPRLLLSTSLDRTCSLWDVKPLIGDAEAAHVLDRHKLGSVELSNKVTAACTLAGGSVVVGLASGHLATVALEDG